MLTQIINKDNKPVPVKLVGDGTDVAKVNIGSFETDSEGKQVLRIIDAAPFAYDPVDDAIRQKVVNQNIPLEKKKYTQTIPASGDADVELNLDVSDYKSFSIGVSGGANHKWSIQVFHQDYNDVMVLGRETIEFTAYEGITEVIPVKTSGLRLKLFNKDTNSHDYKVYLYLRK